MADFAEGVSDDAAKRRLARAIRGKGAFRRFRDELYEEYETKGMKLVLPAFVREGKSYLTCAIGCTGGRHRSVVLASEVANLAREKGFAVNVIYVARRRK